MIAIALWPVPVDSSARPTLDTVLGWLHAHGVPEFIGYNFVEFTANIAFFVPLGLLLSIWLRRFWLSCVLGALASCLIEASQYLFLPNRFATVSDIVANSLGAFIGAVLWLVILRLNHKRQTHNLAFD